MDEQQIRAKSLELALLVPLTSGAVFIEEGKNLSSYARDRAETVAKYIRDELPPPEPVPPQSTNVKLI